MNLTHLSDKYLIRRTDQLAQQERNCLTALLHHLREIDARRLYSALKYKSLFEYTVKRLKYPGDQAYRRIDAMRLLKELPQLESKISSGSLTLTQLNLAQNLFRREKKAKKKYSKMDKLDLFSKLDGKSTRETERELAKISPAAPREKVRAVSESSVELAVTLSNETLEKLERLKGLLAHSCPDISYGELIDKLADEGLRLWDKTAAPRIKVRGAKSEADQSVVRGDDTPKAALNDSGNSKNKAIANTSPIFNANKRYIPRQLYRFVFQRDKSCRQCGSTFALQVDHVAPVALGGTSEVENLRLLCRHCNQRAAIEVFGQKKMSGYL